MFYVKVGGKNSVEFDRLSYYIIDCKFYKGDKNARQNESYVEI